MAERATVRGRILADARKATEGARDKSYGDPSIQLGLAGELKALVRLRMIRKVAPAEMEALDMVLTKLSRAVIGDAPGRDTYVDGAAYFAIAGECAGAMIQSGLCSAGDCLCDDCIEAEATEIFEAARDRAMAGISECLGHSTDCILHDEWDRPGSDCDCGFADEAAKMHEDATKRKERAQGLAGELWPQDVFKMPHLGRSSSRPSQKESPGGFAPRDTRPDSFQDVNFFSSRNGPLGLSTVESYPAERAPVERAVESPRSGVGEG